MNRFLVVIIVISFIGSGLLPSSISTFEERTVYTNHKSGGYIQDLIDNANPGDTIYIPSGIYYENIIINKSISLIGEDKNTTIIDGNGIDSVILIVADWVNVSKFTIQNSSSYYDAGIVISSHNNSIFCNNIMNNLGYGIVLGSEYSLINNNIINNNISNNNGGIVSWACRNLTICNNTFINNKNGLSLEFYCHYCEIKNNILKDNDDGLVLIDSSSNIIENNIFSECGMFVGGWHGSHRNTISNNTFFNNGLSIGWNMWGVAKENYVKDNIANGKPLVYLYNKSDIDISNESGQIILIDCDNITIQNQKISNTTTGIYLLGSVDCYIINNNIGNNNEGIGLFIGSDYTIIKNNTITNNQVGITEHEINDNYLINNIISHNEIGYQGFWVDTSMKDNRVENNILGICINNQYQPVQRFRLSENIIKDNAIGFEINKTDNCIVENNTILENEIGIQISNSNNNTITNNKISSNQEEGILLINSYDNKISENSITENEDGIELEDSNHNIICNNQINLNTDHGVEIIESNSGESINNSIISNIIKSNNKGVYLENASNNTIEKNNFLSNQRDGLFDNCMNTWNHNYWNRPRFLPKVIFGKITIIGFLKIPWFNIDWHPAPKPYEIEA